ncbi:insulin-like growth factor-binding protein complex acid labile subunit isoform X2 [Drosophila willistoni]|uniref:insulin-like growth factor-binding protein complex acid labile subunit isoform X2 n=1 Tax=Drosophila willistoni TaxID=7260 RepID=UPI000C26D53A|nr:insulin-like growth factor-binding protein complex acid labile subunit isoform X2 [Drosophila willistoni]
MFILHIIAGYILCSLLGDSLQVEPSYGTTGRVNLSASCPNAYCNLDLINTNEQHLAYSTDLARNLQQLYLSNCNRYSLPLVLLNLTPNLRTLVMQNCSIYHITKDALKPVANLTSLQVQRTNIWLLRDEQFVAVPKLEMLELGFNSIHTVHGRALMGLERLRLLGLQSNGIAQIMDKTLDPLINLLHLDLSDNEIEHLPGDIFSKNLKLQTLLLNGNRLGQLMPPTLTPLVNLRLLDLSNCGQLEELHLSSAQSVLLEDSGLHSLVIEGGVIKLQAGNNQLTLVSIGDKSSVIELDLHGNLLTGNETERLLRGMWNLQRLDLSKNIIETWPMPAIFPNTTDIFMLPSLTHLNLGYNQLRGLPMESPLLSSRLTQLDISFNHMLTAPIQNLAALQNLEHLYLEGNRLHELDYELLHHQHEYLRELGLYDNEWSFNFLRKMITYLNDRGVHLPVRILHRQENTTHTLIAASTGRHLMNGESLPQSQAQAGVSGIHPYWTLRDVLAFVTLLVVLAILLLQFYHILDDEGCLRRLRQWRRGRQSTIANGTNGARRLDEQDSELK